MLSGVKTNRCESLSPPSFSHMSGNLEGFIGQRSVRIAQVLQRLEMQIPCEHTDFRIVQVIDFLCAVYAFLGSGNNANSLGDIGTTATVHAQ